jgi:hypothetical protein
MCHPGGAAAQSRDDRQGKTRQPAHAKAVAAALEKKRQNQFRLFITFVVRVSQFPLFSIHDGKSF